MWLVDPKEESFYKKLCVCVQFGHNGYVAFIRLLEVVGWKGVTDMDMEARTGKW